MAPSRTVRIGLLVTGTLSGPIEAVHGSYQEFYTNYFKDTAPPSTRVVIDSYHIKKMEFPSEERISEYDLLMVTGSATDAHNDSVKWVRALLDFLKGVIRDHPKVKLSGICFGHQIICRALGGQCGSNGGRWEIGPTPVHLTDTGKSIFGVDRLFLQEMHRDHVPLESLNTQFASRDLYLLGHTDLTENQGVVKFYPPSDSDTEPKDEIAKSHQEIHILTLQGHPEFSEGVVTAIVRARAEDGAMDVPTVTDYWGTGRRWRKTDGFDIVATALWKMLGVIPTGEFNAQSDLHLSHPRVAIRDASTLSKSSLVFGKLQNIFTILNPFVTSKTRNTGRSIEPGFFRQFYDLCLTYLFDVSA
ncbi:Putative glutamine amidotransferase-like protein C13C5.04 [Leucoagaricus sp. SymC.cos]|nr:Putative glutamine amidotransferase-like protein C13C5.04 [Leucoagaricus sp. SymC.cos]